MGFNAKAFATGFLGDQAKQINQRIIEARDYKRELKDNAEEGKTKIEKLQQLKGLALSEISRLRALGFEDKHINAAIASGPKGLFDLSQSAQQEAGRRDFTPGQKFDEYEIESLIDYSDSFAYGDVRSEEFYEMNTALSKPSLGSTQAPERGLMKTLLGIDLDDSVRERLDKDAYYDGYSVMDINEISKQETYDSVAPGTYFSFTPTSDFDPARASSSFQVMMNTIQREISSNSEAGVYTRKAKIIYDQQVAAGLEPEAEVNIAARLAAEDRSQAIFNQVQILTESNPTYLDKMGPLLDRYLTDDQMGVLEYGSLEGDNLERKIVKDLLESSPSIKKDIENTFTVKHKDAKHEIIVGSDGVVKGVVVGGRTIPPEGIDAVLKELAEAGIIPNARLVGDEVDPFLDEVDLVDPVDPVKTIDPEDTSASAISDRLDKAASKRQETMSNKVPPRPDGLTMGSIFGGGALGREDIEDILAGRMTIPKNLRPNQWDELFGDTHDPETGEAYKGQVDESPRPKPRPTNESEQSETVDLRSYENEEESDKAFDSIPIGGSYIDVDGKQYTKTMERK